MAYFFFVDESGVDRPESPYEVLCGVAIKDSDVWHVISRIKALEVELLGMRYATSKREIKAKKFLKKQVFKLATLSEPIPINERTLLAKECVEKGEDSTMRHLTALAQAKLDYVSRILELCVQFRIKVFASISSEPIVYSDSSTTDFLRKNYVYFLERIVYYLEDKKKDDQGIVIFDELEKSRSYILVLHIEDYVKKTSKGRVRSGLILPEPFFVHSDLTTGIQIANFIAYLISWGLRLNGMTKPIREELSDLVALVKPLRYSASREFDDFEERSIWSITYVK